MIRVILKSKSSKFLEEAFDELKYKNIIEMSAMDFLKLTTDNEERERLLNHRKEYLKNKGELADFSYVKAHASMPYLVVDQSNRVTEHEGRNRSLAILNPKKEFLKTKAKRSFNKDIFFNRDNFENPDGKLKVEIKSNHRNVEYLTSQYGESAVVSLKTAKPIKTEFTLEDPAGIGDEEMVYSTLIYKAGTPMGNGRNHEVDRIIKDAAKDASFILGTVYNKMYDYLRKERNWGESYSHHNEVADATDELVNKVYQITDDDGPLLFKMKRGDWFHGGFDRKPVGDIIIKKK